MNRFLVYGVPASILTSFSKIAPITRGEMIPVNEHNPFLNPDNVPETLY
jgi:hypothetical protein